MGKLTGMGETKELRCKLGRMSGKGGSQEVVGRLSEGDSVKNSYFYIKLFYGLS